MAAVVMLQQMRARNAQREQQLMDMQRDQERKREQAAQTGIQMVQGGADLKKVMTVLGADLDEKGRALIEINADTLKKQKKEQEAVGEGGTLSMLGSLVQAGGPVAQRPPGVNDAINQNVAMLQQQLQGNPDLLTQALVRFGNQQSLVDANAQNQTAAREQSFEEQLRLSRAQSGIQQDRELSVDATKRGRDLADKVRDDQRTKALEFYSHALSDSMIAENGSPSNYEQVRSAVENDPVLGGKNASANLSIVEMNAFSAARSAQDASSVVADIRELTGVRIPQRIGQMIVEGKAVEEPLTGLPFRLATGKDAARVAMIQNAIDALARIETYGKRIASAGKIRDASAGNAFNLLSDKYSTGSAEARTSTTARNLGYGIDDPDISAYDAAREAFALAYTYVTTGATANEKQIQGVMAQFPKLSELKRDPKTGGIMPGPRRRLDSSFSNLVTQVVQNSLAGQALTEKKFREAYAVKVADYEKRETALSTLPANAEPVRDQRLPTIAKPR